MKNVDGSPVVDIDFRTHPSDVIPVIDSDIQSTNTEADLSEADQPADETNPEPEKKLSLDDEVAIRSKFLDKKLAFFSAQSKRLGEYNDDIRNENGAEEAFSMIYLKAQRTAIQPLYASFEILDDAILRLKKIVQIHDQTTDPKEKKDATEMIKEIEAGIEDTKQEIIDFDIEEFDKNTLATVENEQNQIKAELANKQRELREIEKEMEGVKKRLQRKHDEINVLKARLIILEIEEEENKSSKPELAAVKESREN